MMRRINMKKIVIFLLVVTILISSSSALMADTTQSQFKSKVTSTKLDDALKAKYLDENAKVEEKPVSLVVFNEKDGKLVIPIMDALKNIEYSDPQIKLYNKKIELYKKQYYISLGEAISAEAYEYPENIDNKKREVLNWKVKLNSYENLKHDRIDVIDNVKLKFEKNYVKGVQLQKDKEVVTQELSKLEMTIKQNTLKLNLGLIKASDLDKLNSAKAQLLAQLSSIDRQLDSISVSIKQSLGIDSSKSISLVPFNKVYEKYDDKSIDQQIKDACTNSYNLVKVNNEIYLAKIEYEMLTSPFEADALENSIQEKEYSIKTIALEEEAKLLNSYYALKNLEDNIEIQRISIDLAKRSLAEIKTKVKLSKATAMDELTASINLAKAENKLQSLISEYIFTQASFVKSLNITSETSK
jgi:hypothetical protein